MYTIDGRYVKNVYIEKFDNNINNLIINKINQDNKIDDVMLNNLRNKMNKNKQTLNKSEVSINELNKKIENVYYWTSNKFDQLMNKIDTLKKNTDDYNQYRYSKIESRVNDMVNFLGINLSGEWKKRDINSFDWINLSNNNNILNIDINKPKYNSSLKFKIVLKLEIDKSSDLEVSDVPSSFTTTPAAYDDANNYSEFDKDYDKMKEDRSNLLDLTIEDLESKLQIIEYHINKLSDELNRNVFNMDNIYDIKNTVSELGETLKYDDNAMIKIDKLNDLLSKFFPIESFEGFNNDEILDMRDIEEKCILNNIPQQINVVENDSKSLKIDFNKICDIKILDIEFMSKKNYEVNDEKYKMPKDELDEHFTNRNIDIENMDNSASADVGTLHGKSASPSTYKSNKVTLVKEIFINIKKNKTSFHNLKEEIKEVNANLNYIYKLNELTSKSQELNKVNIDTNKASIEESNNYIKTVEDKVTSNNRNIDLINDYLNSIKDENVFKQRLYEIGIPILEYPLMIKEYGTNKVSNRFQLIK
tara:strand:- start:919 stop:2514 length:1596 start_codon:yes stop_codon:yes gene_type:complete